MKKIFSKIIIILFLIGTPVFAQIEETHEFGETNVQWYVYSDGKIWEFTAENDMLLETVEVKSVLAAEGGTFHIEVSIKDNVIATWDEYVDTLQYTAYYNTRHVSFSLSQGDAITYKIYGGTFSTPVGGILGINYVKLMGIEDNVDIQFESLSDMNYARFGAGYTYDGNYMYSICGGISEPPWISTTAERYNMASDTWTEFANGIIPRRYCSAEYVSSQDNIYIFNGNTFSGPAYSDTVEIVDVQTGNITYSATNPYPVGYCGSAVWNDKIYIFGGTNDDGWSSRLYEFDPETENWTRLTDMPEAKQTNGEIINGVLYVFGGYNGLTSKRIDAYDIQTQSWTPLGEMPEGVSTHAATKSGNYVWLIGSYNNLKFLASYNTETNIFTQYSSNMIGRRHTGAVIAGNNLYVFGGNQESSSISALRSLQYTDISSFVVSVDDEYNKLTNQIKLYQNYPNPFNPSTKIEYFIPKSSFVSLKVFNVLGNEIFTLVNEEKPVGNYEVEFSTSNLASGVYFYRLQAGNFIDTKKMVLLK